MKTRQRQPRGLLLAGLIYLSISIAVPSQSANSSPFDHSLLTQILQEFVSREGWINYQGLKDLGSGKLALYVERLEKASLSGMSQEELMAFYINAYNAFTLKLIVDNYPLESIRKIPDLSGIAGFGQWKKALWSLNNKKLSLDTIEHKILRPMGDPRIHFALVCAAKSCPDLAPRAYTAENLDEMLETQGRRFNQSSKGLQISSEKRFLTSVPVLKLSSIYKWFRKDFFKVSEDLPHFVHPYANAGVKAFIEKNKKDLKIEYMDYDWSLNRQP